MKSLTTFFKEKIMKMLIAMFTLFSLNVFAAKIEVMSINEPSMTTVNVRDFSLYFNASLTNGNAWIEATTPSTEEFNGVFERAKVQGLYVQESSIVWDVDGQQVVCATLSRGRIFGGTRVRSTGNCKLSVKKVKQTVDDGYEGYSQSSFVVSLETL